MIGEFSKNDNKETLIILKSNVSPLEKAIAWAKSNNENYHQYPLYKKDIYKWFDYNNWEHQIDFDFENNKFRYPNIIVNDEDKKNNGHLTITFNDGKREFTLNLHRLIYCIYNGDLDNIKLVVDHHDNNKLNNRPDNLKLITQWENHVKCFRENFNWLKDYKEILNILETHTKEELLKCK